MPITSSPHDLTLNGLRIYYEVSGPQNGPPVLLIHGWMSDHRTWDSVVPALAEVYRCYAPDLPGFGQSDKPRGYRYTIEEQAAVVAALVDALGLERFALLGHSMGGMISLAVAAQLGSRVERLAVVGSVVEGPMTPYGRFAKWWLDLTVIRWLVPPALRLMKATNLLSSLSARGWYYDPARVSSTRYQASMDAMFPGDNWHAIRQASRSFTQTNIISQAQTITAPTLVVVGRQDNTIPPDQSRVLRAALSNGQLVEYNECGHWPMDEYPAEFNQALCRFLNHHKR